MADRKRKGLFISLDHYISSNDISEKNISNGILKKIAKQIECFRNYGYDMDILCPYHSRNHRLHSIIRRLPFSGILSYGKQEIELAGDYSFIYLRSPWFMNSDTPAFLKNMKKKNPLIKTIVEVPTYDPTWGRGEINHWHMWPLYWKNKKAVRKMAPYVDRVMTFSLDEKIYGVQTICTSNAIDPLSIRPVNHTEAAPNTIQLIACSSMAFWHGYDRILNGMHDYYESKNIPYKILFHVVGDGEELTNYRAIIDKYNLGSYVFLYGYKSGDALDDIYNRADIAIDSLGRHRSKVYYNSSLKGKEYLAKGLPVISGVENELDYDPGFPYYLRVAADESPINMDDIIDFYEKLYSGNKSRPEIVQYISEYAASHFSYKVALKPVVDFIEGEE
jgi:hypothetical protein